MEEKLSYSVDEAVRVTGLGRSNFYKILARGDIESFTVGKRRMVSARALRQFIEQKEREAVRRSVA
ncbi:helix-turn-helix domain-containing protein [Xanthomonas cassavae CFBP 4642]|uniref:Helix-turn-helix domain-containing protein n=1 Tax=Xanthomonas cassavae CFBP 4642 TaxID=1219375 RepID=A0ABS8HHW8_9XANT|nr:helix-turn-helix domain-containing protein [Xanthomonas cassavae]MCC4621770.1 helix-turn-helix domain-containing protein [Xanthomonas cassavae CFBP 4642]